MKKFMLGLALVSALQCNGNDVRIKSSEELAIARDIAALKEKINEYTVSQSFIDSIGDVSGIAALGAAVGACCGIVQIVVLNGLLTDASLLSGQAAKDNTLSLMRMNRIALQAISGAISGFILGTASRTGSLPQLNKNQLLILIALQNGLSTALNIASDCWTADALELRIRRNLHTGTRFEQLNTGGITPNNLATRQGLFSFIGASQQNHATAEETKLFNSTMISMIPHVIAALALVPEVSLIRAHRDNQSKNKEELEDSLRELQRALFKATNDFEISD